MDDALLVRGFDGRCDLETNTDRIFNRHRPACETFREVLPFNEFKNDEPSAGVFLESIDRRDVGMIDRCQYTRFAFESCEPIVIAGEFLR